MFSLIHVSSLSFLVSADDVVEHKHGEKSAEILRSSGFQNITFCTYNGYSLMTNGTVRISLVVSLTRFFIYIGLVITLSHRKCMMCVVGSLERWGSMDMVNNIIFLSS